MSALKAAIFNPQSHLIHMRAALFHSTPVLERKRRNHWQSSRSHQYSNPYTRRFRNFQSKQMLLRNISQYAEDLFQSWKDELDENDPSSSKGTSWFKKQYSRPERAANKGRQNGDRRSFHFCEDEDEMDFEAEKVFRIFRSASGFGSAFCRNQHFHWYFTDEVDPEWSSSSRYKNNYWNYGNWKSRVEEDYEYSTESKSSESAMSLDRRALGLSASGPLKLEEVKNAYRVCALKWHPDRHQGSSKAVAEEKFKTCSQAYQSLCDKLAMN